MDMTGKVVGGRYELRGILGEGGMATIHRAWDRQLEREVAVKILREQYGSDPGFAARFRQEARSAGSLSHPNIVSVYDYGAEDESQFIVMQLIEGRDLSTLLSERGRLPPDEAAHIAAQVASALDAAHRGGIVHRDVKPGNVMITRDGEPKVTDFGIARAASEASMTLTGTTLGSVHYFSPEQARGDEVTGASDVYSLGIVLYEMLTGRRPFEGDSAAGVALKRLTDDPPPPSVYDSSLPEGLVAIVMRALERDPARRFASAGAMAAALHEWERDPRAMPPMPVVLPPERSPATEATIYLPPRLPQHQPPALAPPAGPPRAIPPAYRDDRGRGQPWWIWLFLLFALGLLFAAGFVGVQFFRGLGPASSPTPAIDLVEVPRWAGQPITNVRIQAADIGLEPVEHEEPNEDVPAETVIRTDPGPGTELERGSEVDVYVSTGPRRVEVPQVFGQTRAEAALTLDRAGLGLGSVTYEASNQPAETALRTEPSAGTEVNEGESVDLVLSSGPAPTPTPSPPPPPTPTPTPTPPPPTPTPTPATTILP